MQKTIKQKSLPMTYGDLFFYRNFQALTWVVFMAIFLIIILKNRGTR